MKIALIDHVDRVVEVGVVEDQVGALAAQLEADRREVGRGRLADHPAGAGLAGEGDPVDAAVLGERRAGRVGAEAVHDVEDAGRQAGLERPAGPAASPDVGVSSAGLSTTVLPHASAGAIFQDSSISGKFHGEIAATTPAGWNSE